MAILWKDEPLALNPVCEDHLLLESLDDEWLCDLRTESEQHTHAHLLTDTMGPISATAHRGEHCKMSEETIKTEHLNIMSVSVASHNMGYVKIIIIQRRIIIFIIIIIVIIIITISSSSSSRIVKFFISMLQVQLHPSSVT